MTLPGEQMRWRNDRLIEHLLRRAGFGASADDLATFGRLSYSQAVDRLSGGNDGLSMLVPYTDSHHNGHEGHKGN